MNDMTPESLRKAIAEAEDDAAAGPAAPDMGFRDDPLPSSEADDAPSGGDDATIDLAIVEACAGLDQSDTDNGQRLIRHRGEDILVMLEEGSKESNWLTWTGTHWDQRDGHRQTVRICQGIGARVGLEAQFLQHTPVEVTTIAAAKALQIADEAKPTDEEIEMKKAGEAAKKALETRKANRRKFGVSVKNADRINKMMAMAAPHLVREADEFNAEARLVYTLNGTLRFNREEDPDRSGEVPVWRGRTDFTPAGWNRADKVTRVIPVNFDPAAPCPKWDAFVSRFLPVDAVRKAVQIYCGLGLTGLAIQRLFFHYGLGANGKSVFLEVLTRVLGPIAEGLPSESISGSSERGQGAASPDLARLYGVRFCRVTEMPEGELLREALVKKLTGGEKIDVRTLFKGYFSFQPQFKAHMSGNAYPRVDGSDNGIWRRLVVVPWTVTIPEAEQRDFEEVVSELVAEAPGILNWLCAGVNIYDSEGLHIPDAMKEAAAAYREEMDPISSFIGACVRPAEGAEVKASALYMAYESWSLANAKRAKTQTKFGAVMATRFTRASKAAGNVYLNVELHDVPARPGQDRYDPRNPDSGWDDGQ